MTQPQQSADPSLLEVSVPVATMWTSPEAPRVVDEAAVRDLPDVAEWAAALDGEARQGLHGRTLSQLLLGEAVRVVEERDGWARVVALLQPSSRDRDGYPGWVRRAHLDAPVPRRRGAAARVVAAQARLEAERGAADLSFGTRLWVDRVGEETARVLLPGGGTGELALGDVRLTHTGEQVFYGPDDVLGLARQFLDLPYLWGGTSSWGLDCSGLVHLVHRALGVTIPRDASDQAAGAADGIVPVPLDGVLTGDLYFFARPGSSVHHVGIASGPAAADGAHPMLHAPDSGGDRIEDRPMAPERVATLVSAGRVQKPPAPRVVRPTLRHSATTL